MDVGWGMGQTGNQPAAPSSLLPVREPDGTGSYSTWGNRVVCSRRLGKGGSQRSTGKTCQTIKSQKEKCFFLLQCSQLRRVWGGENRPRQVELSSYDSVALLVFFFLNLFLCCRFLADVTSFPFREYCQDFLRNKMCLFVFLSKERSQLKILSKQEWYDVMPKMIVKDKLPREAGYRGFKVTSCRVK